MRRSGGRARAYTPNATPARWGCIAGVPQQRRPRISTSRPLQPGLGTARHSVTDEVAGRASRGDILPIDAGALIQRFVRVS
jgi:hypothetical protein